MTNYRKIQGTGRSPHNQLLVYLPTEEMNLAGLKQGDTVIITCNKRGSITITKGTT